MAVSNVQQLIVPAVLSDYAIEYAVEGYLGDKLITKVPVRKPSGKYRKRNKDNMLRIVDARVGETGKPAELSLGYTNANFSTEDYALETIVPVATAQAADDTIDLEMDAVRQLKVSMKIAEEQRIMTLLTTAGNYDTANKAALVGTAQWSDYTNSDPLPVITDLMRKMWRSPTTKKVAWAGSDVWEKLRHHPKILNRLGLSAGATTALPARVLEQAFAALIGADEFYVADGRFTSTNPGATPVYGYLWGKNFGVTSVEKNPTTQSLSFASQFVWVDSEVSAWFNPEPGLRGGIYHKLAQSTDEVLVSSEAAILIQTAVALWRTRTSSPRSRRPSLPTRSARRSRPRSLASWPPARSSRAIRTTRASSASTWKASRSTFRRSKPTSSSWPASSSSRADRWPPSI